MLIETVSTEGFTHFLWEPPENVSLSQATGWLVSPPHPQRLRQKVRTESRS